jgi:hypothetical protein
VHPIPFNQYGSNVEDDTLFGAGPVLQPDAISMTITLDEDSPPVSDSLDPQILKRAKMSAADRNEIGWESPEDCEFDNETLASKIAKLKKKKQDGKVEKSPVVTTSIDLAKEVAAATDVSKAKSSMAILPHLRHSHQRLWVMLGGRIHPQESMQARRGQSRYAPTLVLSQR